MFRFVHTADVHLDSPLRSLALRDPALAEMIGNATRRAFVNIIDLCIEERVDALVLAGDLYDGDQTSMKTAKFLALQLHRLHQAGIKVFLVRGNHDAESRITKELTLPENVKIFTGRADRIDILCCDGGMPIAVHGISFADPIAPMSLLPKLKPPLEGAFNIGIMHTSLTGADGHNTYAPCALSELQASGHRYWALGHIHKRAVYERAACTVVMPGNPQGRDINEAGTKTVTLVTVGDDGSVETEERLTSIAEFTRLAVSMEGHEDWAAIVAAIRSKVESARSQARSEHLVARIVLSGQTPAAWQLRQDAKRLKAEADVCAELVGKTWIEKIEINCRPLRSDALADVGDALSELVVEIEDEILSSPSFLHELSAIGKELWDVLPRECQTAFGGVDEAKFNAILQGLAQEGVDQVLARLHAKHSVEIF